jgi:hypothetical protein
LGAELVIPTIEEMQSLDAKDAFNNLNGIYRINPGSIIFGNKRTQNHLPLALELTMPFYDSISGEQIVAENSGDPLISVDPFVVQEIIDKLFIYSYRFPRKTNLYEYFINDKILQDDKSGSPIARAGCHLLRNTIDRLRSSIQTTEGLPEGDQRNLLEESLIDGFYDEVKKFVRTISLFREIRDGRSIDARMLEGTIADISGGAYSYTVEGEVFITNDEIIHLLELVRNAKKHVPIDNESARRIAVKAQQDSQNRTYRVQNFGDPIYQEMIDTVLFNTNGESGASTGRREGLGYVQEDVVSWGGSLSIDSSTDRGRFEYYVDRNGARIDVIDFDYYKQNSTTVTIKIPIHRKSLAA